MAASSSQPKSSDRYTEIKPGEGRRLVRDAGRAGAGSAEMRDLSRRDIEIIAAWSGHEPESVEADIRLQEMGRLAISDALTGLYNRRYFNARLEMEAAAGNRLVVAVIDLDRFKTVNDTLGHDRGDEVLRAFARRLESKLDGAVVSRFGGDEFAVIFERKPVDAAAVALERLLQNTSAGENDFAGFAAGLAEFPRDGEDPDVLLKAADAAMYRAKRTGRPRVRLVRDLDETTVCGDPRIVLRADILVGRETLWERLRERMARAEEGRGCLIALEGGTGCGKTRLLAELADSAAKAGWRVARVGPHNAIGPYRPFLAARRELAAQHGDRENDGAEPIERTNEAVKYILRASIANPLLVCVDDLQEAENLSAMALAKLGWALPRHRLVLAAAVRMDKDDGLDWDGLRGLGTADGWLVRERIEGLDLAGTHKLASSLLRGALSRTAARILHEISGGNPLHLTHVLKALIGMGVLTPGPRGWTLNKAEAVIAPRDLLQALIWRMRQMEDDLREFLGLASSLGTEFLLSDLQDLAGSTPDEIDELMESAVREQVLSVNDGMVHFVHPLLQQAAYTTLSLQTLRLAHRVAAQQKASRPGATASTLAWHYDEAGLRQEAFHHHFRAAEEAALRYAHHVARRHYQRAWELLPGAGVPFEKWWTRTALELSAAMRASGDHQAAVAVCRDALRHRSVLPPVDVRALLLELGTASFRAGNRDEAAEVYRELAKMDGPEIPEEERIRISILGLQAERSFHTGESAGDEASGLAARALRLGERSLAGRLYSEASVSMALSGRPLGEAAAMNRLALPLVPMDIGYEAVMVRLRASQYADRIGTARRWLQEALQVAAVFGEAGQWVHLLRLMGDLARRSGRFTTARRYFEVCVELAGRCGNLREKERALAELGTLIAWMGKTSEGISLVEASVESSAQRKDALSEGAGCGYLAWCLLASGRPQGALAALERAERVLPAKLYRSSLYGAVRVDALLQSREIGGALEAAGTFRDEAPDWMNVAYHHLVAGRLELAAGQAERSLECFRSLRALAGRPTVEQYWLAWGCLEEASALSRLGMNDDADHRRAQAGRMFRRMEAATALSG